jgi:hypothetical protein
MNAPEEKTALDELIENEQAVWDGKTIPHLSGSTSRRKRVGAARVELEEMRLALKTATVSARHDSDKIVDLYATNISLREEIESLKARIALVDHAIGNAEEILSRDHQWCGREGLRKQCLSCGAIEVESGGTRHARGCFLFETIRHLQAFRRTK